jgi:hypothetical protein
MPKAVSIKKDHDFPRNIGIKWMARKRIEPELEKGNLKRAGFAAERDRKRIWTRKEQTRRASQKTGPRAGKRPAAQGKAPEERRSQKGSLPAEAVSIGTSQTS